MNENYDPLDKELNRLVQVIARLRAEDGCPWDREQTHGSLKAACVEEAAEVVGGINILEQTGNAENLKEPAFAGGHACADCKGRRLVYAGGCHARNHG